MFFDMRRTGPALIGIALFACAAGAQQVDVSLTMGYTVYVVGEPVLVQFDILNATRDRIRAGVPDAADTVLLEISTGGRYNEVKAFNTVPIAGAVELKPGEAFQRKVELDKWFPLVAEGKYLARLVVVHGGMRYASPERSFDVVPGMPVIQAVQMFVNKPKLKRLFRLVHWHRNQTDRLFLRIEDEPDAKVWDTIDLGILLRTTEPKIDLSPEGEVTVLHRSTQDAFIYTVIWSLPENVEVMERKPLLDPDISASQRVRSVYGEMSEDTKKDVKKPWWKIW